MNGGGGTIEYYMAENKMGEKDGEDGEMEDEEVGLLFEGADG